jgi:hypothetical protein
MTSVRVENIELDSGPRNRSLNVAQTTAIERPKNAANAPEGAATRPSDAGNTFDAACCPR